MKYTILQALMNTDITFEEMTKIENYLNELEEDRDLLYALQAAGVDNWCGYEEAMKICRENQEEE